MLISLAEYAALHDRAAITVRKKAKCGGFKTARKIGHNWVIDSDEPYEDNRHGDPDNVIRTRTCRQCGKEFQGGPRAWYCPECRSPHGSVD
jgi:rubrerythrin